MEDLGDQDASVGLLVILEDRDPRAADSESAAVERVRELGLCSAGSSKTEIHPASLEIAAIGAARDLAVRLLAWQPNLDVVSLSCTETHVTC